MIKKKDLNRLRLIYRLGRGLVCSGILRDKINRDKLKYILKDAEQNISINRLKFWLKSLDTTNLESTNKNSIKVPKVLSK